MRDKKLRGCSCLSPLYFPALFGFKHVSAGKNRKASSGNSPMPDKEALMRIVTYGRGNVGGGLAELWKRAGHDVTSLGREGGDVSEAEVVLLAIPGGTVSEGFRKLRGFEGKLFIDATNRFGIDPPAGFASNAEFVKTQTGGPTAKAYNLNYARLYDRIGKERARPCNLWCGDDEATETVETLSRDIGYDPVRIGLLDMAGLQEAMIKALSGAKEEIGLFFYRAAPPGEL